MSCNSISSNNGSKTIREILKEAVAILEASEIEDAKHNANLLVAKLLSTPYTKLPFFWSEKASEELCTELSSMLQRRINKEPLQYILGEWSFLDFDVNIAPGVLIPRPETEEVFLAAVDAIKQSSLPSSFTFADIGTGTGILGIAMATYFPNASGSLVDISDDALRIAKSNLERYPELAGRTKLVKSDLLEAFSPDSLDVIISNPPYIDSEEVKTLMPEVVNHEPHLALDGGPGGLILIDKLLKQAETVLRPKGLFIFEHGHDQRKEIKKQLTDSWSIIKEGNDFAGNERYFILELLKKN